jgi:hypothetical protein
MIPEPVTPSASDFGHRALCVSDLEETLVRFIRNLFIDTYRLDNPTLNLAQQPGAFPKSYNPDDVPVSFDPTARAQTLALKVAPRIERGRIPRTVTGEIALDKLPDCPAIIVQMVSANIENTETFATVKLLLTAYDENPDSRGYQDVQNMSELLWIALTSFGQQAIDRAYPIVMPIEWKLIEPDTFPHFVAEMTTKWELPSGRPLPQADYIDIFPIVPSESINMSMENIEPPLPPKVFQDPQANGP